MERNAHVEIEESPDAFEDNAQRILLEIANDARSLKERYLRETVVPEGGE